MKKTATRWAAISAGALGAALLVAPGASAVSLSPSVEQAPVQVVPSESPSIGITLPGPVDDTPDPGGVTVLVPGDGDLYTPFGRWDDELI